VLGQPFTRCIRKLAAYLHRMHGRVIRIGREALRCLLAHRRITFQRTKTNVKALEEGMAHPYGEETWRNTPTPSNTKPAIMTISPGR